MAHLIHNARFLSYHLGYIPALRYLALTVGKKLYRVWYLIVGTYTQ